MQLDTHVPCSPLHIISAARVVPGQRRYIPAAAIITLTILHRMCRAPAKLPGAGPRTAFADAALRYLRKSMIRPSAIRGAGAEPEVAMASRPARPNSRCPAEPG